MDNFQRYVELRDRCQDGQTVYRQARADGWDFVTSIRMLRRVFDFDLVQAKEVIIVSDTDAKSLGEHQERFLPALEAAFSEADAEADEPSRGT